MTARDFCSKAFVLRSYSGCFPAMGRKKIPLEPSCLSPFRRWHVLNLMSILANMGYSVTNSWVLFWVLTAHCWQHIADSAFRKPDITFVWEAGPCSLVHRYQRRREMCCFHLQVVEVMAHLPFRIAASIKFYVLRRSRFGQSILD